ncbi:MAG: F0F1 ATP synthase subunit delta [Campylobacterota bacterium]|nr:F0F1 ATP synthase subunit delta [Campylobacterota bacterium]
MFNWWTFFFQVINFFIVLFILYRLFFNPLKRVIQKREEAISQRMKKLEEGEKHVEEEKERYQEKMDELQTLREKKLDEVKKEALIEKDILMKEADKEIAKAYEKQSGIIDQERKKFEKEIRQKSLEFSIHYTEKLLNEVSDKLLHQKRIDQFLQALPQSNAKEIALLKEELAGKACEVMLYTPFNLQETTNQKIKETIGRLLQCNSVVLQSVQDVSLIGGIRLAIKNKILDASIKGELERFKEQMENEL